MITNIEKLYWIKDRLTGTYIVGVSLKDQAIDVTVKTNEARTYREEEVEKNVHLVNVLYSGNRWDAVDSGDSIELHYSDDIREYKDAVINGILKHFSDAEKKGVHAVNYKYIEDMVSSRMNQHREEELPYEETITTSWSECYQEGTCIEDAVEMMYPGCRTLYIGHMSVL
jgi:hypothetical protein